MVTKRIIVELANEVYSNKLLSAKNFIVSFNNEIIRFKIVGKVNTSNKLFGGLEAIALENNNELIFVIRGADVGIGVDIFKLLSADENFIPISKDSHRVRASFQDWIWNGFFGTLGLVNFSQYADFKKFYLNVLKQIPDKNITVIGHSLGGEIAQKLSVELNVHAITFSALSPWWALSHNQRKEFKNGTLNDKNIENYFSGSDPFRYFPLLARRMGKQNPVKLRNYVSHSSLAAMFLERIYWAHGLNNYDYADDGEILLLNSEPIFDRILNTLNRVIVNPKWINIAIFASGFLPCLTMWLTGQIAIQHAVPQFHISELNILLMATITVIVTFISWIYMLPTLLIHSRWKYLVWGFNVCFSWTGIGWGLLLMLSFVLNSITIDK